MSDVSDELEAFRRAVSPYSGLGFRFWYETNVRSHTAALT